jgi:predicted RNase H-like HicB family nuclease
MSSIEQYRTLKYPMLIEPGEEGGFLVTYPDLPGVVGEGETVTEATDNAEELRMVWTETCLEDGMEVPQPGELASCNGTLTLRIPPSLHKRLSLRARSEKISLNRLISYLLSTSISVPAILDRLRKDKEKSV